MLTVVVEYIPYMSETIDADSWGMANGSLLVYKNGRIVATYSQWKSIREVVEANAMS
jgi:hypothetical protein